MVAPFLSPATVARIGVIQRRAFATGVVLGRSKTVVLKRYNPSTDTWDAQPAQTVLVRWAARQPMEAGTAGSQVETQIADATLVWEPGTVANVLIGDRLALDGNTGIVDAVHRITPERTEATVNFDQGGA